MSDHPRPTRLSRLLSRCYPRDLREQYADDIARFIDDARRDPRNHNNPVGMLRVAGSLTRDALTSLADSVLHGRMRNGTPRPIGSRNMHITHQSNTKRFRSFSMDTLLQDTRFALRGFLRRPGFTAVALVTLALGIGGTSAIFTLVNAVLLQSLPYPNPDQLVNIWGSDGTPDRTLLSVPYVEDLVARNKTFAELGVVRGQSVNLTGGDRPDRVTGNFITASSLHLLAPTMALGRIFTEEETRTGAGQPVAVITYDTWQARYGGRADMIGQTLVLNGLPHVVIGVSGRGFRDPQPCDVWLPITSAPSASWFERGTQQVWAVGRLKPGITLAQAQRDLSGVAVQLDDAQSASAVPVGVTVLDLRESLVGGSRFTLMVLFGAVGAVLLIVCVNIANLQLVRASTRQREMSLRAALGANRARLVSQTLVESLLLSLLGGALGVGVSQLILKALMTVLPDNLPLLVPPSIDARVLLFTLAIALLTGMLFGVPAALVGSRTNLQGALRTRTEQLSTRRFNARNILVVSELALCIVLLSVAGLFTRSLQALQHVETGYHTDHVLTAEFRLPAVKYTDSVKVQQFMDAALVQLRNIPGVTQAALVDAVPLSGNYGSMPYVPQGQGNIAQGAEPQSQVTAVSDQYFSTLRIPLLEGRDFDAHDRLGAETVMIVNKVLADRAWPGESAVGKTIQLMRKPVQIARVIGVVANVKQVTVNEAAAPQFYLAKAQATGIFSTVVLRSAGDPEALANSLRKALWAVDPDQPVWKIRTLQSLADRDLSPTRFSVTIIGGFALLALLLGTVGVYGVMSFSVQQRSREMGIRLALGARGDQVLGLMMRSGIEVVAVAVMLGLLGAVAAGRLVQSQLFNVAPADLATFVLVPVVLGSVALLACWWPARRAARVDPVVTLRSE